MRLKSAEDTCKINGIDPTECPSDMLITTQTLAHSRPHFSPFFFASLAELSNSLRPGVGTSVLVDSSFSLEYIIENYLSVSSLQEEVELDPKAKFFIETGSDTIAFLVSFRTSEGQKYTFKVVRCRHEKCMSNENKEEITYIKDEVVSIFPVCGPNVFKLPKMENFKINKADNTLTVTGKVKENLCR